MFFYKSTTACHSYLLHSVLEYMINLSGPHPETGGLTQQAMTAKQSDFCAT